mmetsp:Transcript_11189/g.30094  ORF Transcript_11189/g.30094 Transcript_11189/m.30094 type:complete len:369 (+) Transcript_11189:75-1181(+)
MAAGRWIEALRRSGEALVSSARAKAATRIRPSPSALFGPPRRGCAQQSHANTPSTAPLTPAAEAADAGATRASTNSAKDGARAEAGGFTLGRFFAVSLGVAGVGLGALYLARPETTRQLLDDAVKQIDTTVKYFTEPSRDKFLPEPIPMYPGGPPMRTLVLDFDETLVYSSWTRQSGWKVAKRPGLEAFLAYMSSFYEIVVFTSGLNTYADPILDKLDPNGYVMHRLYRDSTKYEDGVHVFDLSKLNRDLENVVLVDSHVEHAKYQPDNLLLVPAWKADPRDRTLLDLIPLLESLVRDDTKDVRPVITSYAGTNIADEFQRRKSAAIGGTAPGGWSGGFAQGSGGSVAPADKLEPPPGSIWGRLRSQK